MYRKDLLLLIQFSACFITNKFLTLKTYFQIVLSIFGLEAAKTYLSNQRFFAKDKELKNPITIIFNINVSKNPTSMGASTFNPIPHGGRFSLHITGGGQFDPHFFNSF